MFTSVSMKKTIGQFFKKMSPTMQREGVYYFKTFCRLVLKGRYNDANGININLDLSGKRFGDKYIMYAFCLKKEEPLEIMSEFVKLVIRNYFNKIKISKNLMKIQSFSKDDPIKMIYYSNDIDRNSCVSNQEEDLPSVWINANREGIYINSENVINQINQVIRNKT